MKLMLLRLVVVVGVAALFAVAGCKNAPPPEAEPVVRPVKVLTVGLARSSGPLSFPGRVAAINQVDLAFRVGGPLIELPAREGDTVRQGQLLARIDPRDFQLAIDAARARYERTDADFERFAALYEKDAVSKAQLDQARAARDVADASLEDARAAFSDTYLKAPFSARVGARFVENFQDVRPKEAVLSLVDVSEVKIEVDITEAQLASYRGYKGRVTARFDSARDREFDLEVLEIAAQADPRTQTYRGTLVMPQPSGLNVLPGMTANVTHYGAALAEDAILVPAVSVFADSSGVPQGWVVDRGDDTVHRRSVRTGALVGQSQILVEDGLQPGETIAVTAVTLLREGLRVRPVDEVRGL
jgi:RND family efflux transporter MFP subunit